LGANGADPTALFQQALLDHPRDFWLHLHAVLFTKEPEVKIGLALAVLAIRPQTPLAYFILGQLLLERGHWAEALLAANRAIKISPNYASPHRLLGLALRDKKDLPGAVAALKRAADLDPGYALPCWDLGDVFRLQGNRVAAADAYRKAADREGTPAAFRKLGGCLRDLKDQPGAAAAFQRAIELAPGDLHNLGQVLQQQGRYAEAEEAYLGAIQAQPASAPAYDALARLLATCPDDKARDGKRAVEYATTACERTGWKDPLCLDTMAAAYAEAGQFEQAVYYQTRALVDSALTYEFRAAARQRLELYRQKKPFHEEGP
jgi:tetratricopeptide (TPR) repeat protein